jgi:DNA-binding NarL/FixJ family response regulator
MRVLICDDHPVVASAIGMMIEARFDASVEIASSCTSALDRVRADGPFDLLLLDLHIPNEDPLCNLRAAREACPHTPIVVFSASEDFAHIRLALELDVRGFIPKSSRPEVIEAALRLVLAGGRYLPETVGAMALAGAEADHQPAGAAGLPATELSHCSSALTDRQIEVLRMLASGAENKQIARALGISPYTIKAHLAQIFIVLGASNRTQAVVLARQKGLL